MNEVGDEILAQRAASGNMEAFEELVNRHRSTVYRLARTVTGNHHDADDAAQETFVRVFRALGSFDPNRPFRPWLKDHVQHESQRSALVEGQVEGNCLGEPAGIGRPIAWSGQFDPGGPDGRKDRRSPPLHAWRTSYDTSAQGGGRNVLQGDSRRYRGPHRDSHVPPFPSERAGARGARARGAGRSER